MGIIVCVIKLRHAYTGRMYAYIYRRLSHICIRAGTKVKFYIMILSMIFGSMLPKSTQLFDRLHIAVSMVMRLFRGKTTLRLCATSNEPNSHSCDIKCN